MISTISFAKTENKLEFGPSLSIHPMKAKKGAAKFENKVIDNSGTFVQNYRLNLSIVERKNNSFTKLTLLWGRDCMNVAVFGLTRTWGTALNNKVDIGFALGGYIFKKKKWEDSEMPKSWINIDKLHGFVPVIGLDLNIELFKIGPLEINWSSYINPILTNTMIGISINF